MGNKDVGLGEEHHTGDDTLVAEAFRRQVELRLVHAWEAVLQVARYMVRNRGR